MGGRTAGPCSFWRGTRLPECASPGDRWAGRGCGPERLLQSALGSHTARSRFSAGGLCSGRLRGRGSLPAASRPLPAAPRSLVSAQSALGHRTQNSRCPRGSSQQRPFLAADEACFSLPSMSGNTAPAGAAQPCVQLEGPGRLGASRRQRRRTVAAPAERPLAPSAASAPGGAGRVPADVPPLKSRPPQRWRSRREGTRRQAPACPLSQ